MNINKEALLETGKEVARWALLFVVSWILTATLAQINLVPESQSITIWVFTYLIPVRALVNLGLTFLLKMVDNYIHEVGVDKNIDTLKTGLVRF